MVSLHIYPQQLQQDRLVGGDRAVRRHQLDVVELAGRHLDERLTARSGITGGVDAPVPGHSASVDAGEVDRTLLALPGDRTRGGERHHIPEYIGDDRHQRQRAACWDGEVGIEQQVHGSTRGHRDVAAGRQRLPVDGDRVLPDRCRSVDARLVDAANIGVPTQRHAAGHVVVRIEQFLGQVQHRIDGQRRGFGSEAQRHRHARIHLEKHLAQDTQDVRFDLGHVGDIRSEQTTGVDAAGRRSPHDRATAHIPLPRPRRGAERQRAVCIYSYRRAWMDIHPSRVGGWCRGTTPGEGDVESRTSRGHGDVGRKEFDVGITPGWPAQQYSRGGIEALAAAEVGEVNRSGDIECLPTPVGDRDLLVHQPPRVIVALSAGHLPRLAGIMVVPGGLIRVPVVLVDHVREQFRSSVHL